MRNCAIISSICLSRDMFCDLCLGYWREVALFRDAIGIKFIIISG